MIYAIPLFALLLLLCFLLGGPIGVSLSVVGFLAVLYLLSRTWGSRSVVGLRVERRFIERAFPGEEIIVRVRIENGGPVPVPWIEVAEEVPQSLTRERLPAQVLHLPPRAHRELEYGVRCRSRGFYELGPLRARTGDLFGFLDRATTLQESNRLIVYPRIVPLERLHLPTHSALAAVPAATSLFEDPSNVVGVRAYQPPDSQRRIHWRATARSGTILVKQYQRAVSRETLVCLDLSFGGYETRERHKAMEMSIVVAASVAHHIVQNEQLACGLVTHAFDPLSDRAGRLFLPPRAERRHLVSLLEVLARVQGTRGEGLANTLRRERTSVEFGATIVGITGRLSSELLQAAMVLKRGGHAVAIILIQPLTMATRSPRVEGIATYHVWTDNDLVHV